MERTWITSFKAATVALSSSARDFFLCLPSPDEPTQHMSCATFLQPTWSIER